MRVLILSVTAGFGHHATAKAIGDMLESKGAEVHTLDVYAYISNLIKTTIDKGYLFSSKHMQTLYRLVYQLAENNGASYFNSAPSIINIINALGASKFAKVIANHVPDVIICTHVFAAQMVDELKKRKKLADIETIGIVTDYTLHPYWEDVPRVQYIVTASELLTYRCVQRGIPEDRILPFGIPVHPKFNEKLSREDAAAQLGIDPKMKTILLMGGSMGHADHVKNIESLSQIGTPFQFLVVCGNNKKIALPCRAVCRALSGQLQDLSLRLCAQRRGDDERVRLHCIQAGRSYRVRGSGEKPADAAVRSDPRSRGAQC